jgi:23S rRNA pseudouridine1911/1915/1917 synthase
MVNNLMNSEEIDDTDTVSFVIEDALDGQRLDKALSILDEKISRSRLKVLIEDGRVSVNGQVCTGASIKVEAGDEVELQVPPPVVAEPAPENIPLNIVYEDDDVIVLNKPAGLVVHPGAGHYSGTLVNALLYHCGESLSGIGGVMRPGIVHRLDKETSGLMIVAKNDHAHQGLSAQLEDRSLRRIYKVLVFKTPMPVRGTVNQPIGRHHVHRKQMTVNHRYGRTAATHYQVLENFNEACAFVECRLESGRTHQIRVHMQFIKHPVLGDPLYGPQNTAVTASFKRAGYAQDVIDAVLAFPRQALHAQSLTFIHPRTGDEMSFESDLPEDIAKLLKLLETVKKA